MEEQARYVVQEMDELSSCFGTRSIDPGSAVHGAIADEIPIDRSEFLLEGQWSISDYDVPETRCQNQVTNVIGRTYLFGDEPQKLRY